MVDFNQWPISDFHHIIKNQRSRLFHDMSLTEYSETLSLDSYYNIIQIESFSDKTQTSKYFDKLAINAFSIKNV